MVNRRPTRPRPFLAACCALLLLGAPMALPAAAQTTPQPAPAPAPAAPAPAAPAPAEAAPAPAPVELAVAAAGTAECSWIGQRILVLLWRDDIDTANRFFTVYDRFACPMEHAGVAFRCLVQLGAGQGEGDPGLPERAKACWENPGLDPAALAPAAGQEPPVDGSQPATTTGGQQPTTN